MWNIITWLLGATVTVWAAAAAGADMKCRPAVFNVVALVATTA